MVTELIDTTVIINQLVSKQLKHRCIVREKIKKLLPVLPGIVFMKGQPINKTNQKKIGNVSYVFRLPRGSE
jgi:hypothetical protein